MTQREYRQRIISKAKEQGYATTGFRKAVREPLQKWYDEECADYLDSGEYEGEDKGNADDPSVWVNPTAWRVRKTKDAIGREWIVFECVEAVGLVSTTKMHRYAEMWFYLDSTDYLIALDLLEMDEYGKTYPVNLADEFYKGLGSGVAEVLGTVDRSMYSKADEKHP